MAGEVCGVPGSVVGTFTTAAVGGETCGAGPGGVGPGPGGWGVGPGVGPGGVCGGTWGAGPCAKAPKAKATADARTALRMEAFMRTPGTWARWRPVQR